MAEDCTHDASKNAHDLLLRAPEIWWFGPATGKTIGRPPGRRKMTIVTFGRPGGVVQFRGGACGNESSARRKPFIARPTCGEVSRPGPIRQPREVGAADTVARFVSSAKAGGDEWSERVQQSSPRSRRRSLH